MIHTKNMRIKELEQVVRQLIAHNNLFLKSRISNNVRLRLLTKNAETVLGDDNGSIQRADADLHGKKEETQGETQGGIAGSRSTVQRDGYT